MHFKYTIKAHYTVLKPVLLWLLKSSCIIFLLIVLHILALKLGNYYFYELGIGKDTFIPDPDQSGSDCITGITVNNFYLAYVQALFTLIIAPIILFTFAMTVNWLFHRLRILALAYRKAYKQAYNDVIKK